MLRDKFKKIKTAQDKKEIDINGYWLIKDNPMTKAGVFPYLGKQISPELEPDKIYQVLRPKEELTKPETLKSLELIPLLNDHEMVGKDFTPVEEKGSHGTTGQNVKVKGNMITNDLRLLSEVIKDEVESGKKDLSMGYRCRYELTPGEYNGQHYDAIQRDILYNHIALVDEGRMGSDVRVMDSFTFDSIKDLTQDNDKTEWITIKGNHIPVKEGQTKKEAAKSFLNRIREKNNPLKNKKKQNQIEENSKRIKEKEEKISKEYTKIRTKEYLNKIKNDPQRDGEILTNSDNTWLLVEIRGKGKDKEGWELVKGGNVIKYFDEPAKAKQAWEDGYFENIDKMSKTNDSAINQKETTMAEEKTTQDTDKRELIREVMAIAAKPNDDFAGGEEEKIDTITKKLEEIAYNPSESGANDEDIEEEKKTEDEEGQSCKDEDPKEEEEEKPTEDEDKRKLIDEIGGILKGKVDDEIWRTIIGKVEKVAYEPSETGANDEDPKKDDEEKPVSMDAAIKYLARKENLVNKLKPVIGENAKFPSMTIKEITKYACDKLDIRNSIDSLEGYLAAHKKSADVKVSLDNASFIGEKRSPVIENYLK